MLSLRPDRMRPEVAGRIMLTVAAVGVLVGIAGTIVGWRLAGHLFDGVDDSLTVATQSLATVDESITVIETIVADVRGGVSTLDRTVADVVEVSEASTAAISELAEQAPALATGVESVRDGIEGMAQVGTTIDRMLRSLGNLPGVPDYAPARPLGEAMSDVAGDLDGIATSLRSFDRNLQDVDAAVAPLLEDLRQIRQDLTALDRSLESSGVLLEQYRGSAARASTVAVRTQSNLADDVRAARIMIVLGGLVFTVGQIVPYWIGRTILLEAAPITPDGASRGRRREASETHTRRQSAP